MEVKEAIINEYDLKKLCEKAGIPSIRQLAIKAGISYEYLNRVHNGKLIMGEKAWQKIKEALETPNGNPPPKFDR